MEMYKRLKYPTWADDIRAEAEDFAPLVLESHGRLGEASAHTVKRLAGHAARARGLSAEELAQAWTDILSTRLAKDQAEILLNG